MEKSSLTLDQYRRDIAARLTAGGIENPALDARLLLRQGGDFSDSAMIAAGQAPLSNQTIENTEKLITRRLAGEPVSRIVGEREFWGQTFRISPDTLDPRPDTETLVEAALKTARENIKTGEETGLAAMASANNEAALRILDLGSGSGCILISLLKELPDATGVGIDISHGALEVAQANAESIGVAGRAEFRQGSWFEPLSGDEAFDLIVSNPPYIPESDIESLAPEVRLYDPMRALTGGESGFSTYKIILQNLKKHLSCGGRALFEIGRGQEEGLARLVRDSNMYVCESYCDLAGIIRVIEVRHGEK